VNICGEGQRFTKLGGQIVCIMVDGGKAGDTYGTFVLIFGGGGGDECLAFQQINTII